jgi:ABC-type sugar transport system substrate-binding protein
MKEKLRVWLVVLLVFTTAFTVFAGGQKEEKDEDMTIAVIPLSLGNPWWVKCEEGAMKAGEDLGINIIYTAPEVEDAAKQLDVFNDMVNRDVDAIIIAAVDSETLKQPIKDAIDSGIPVFGFDVGAPDTDTLWLASGWEPTISGTNIANGLAESINEKGKVAVLTGTLGTAYLAARQKSIEDTLAKYPDIEVVGVYANENDPDKALQQCESILQAHPDLKGFANTNTTSAPAAALAIKNAGLEGQVEIWGVGLAKANNEYVKAGIANGLLFLDPAKMTYLGVLITYRYLQDGSLPKPGDDFGWAGESNVVPEQKAVYVGDTLLTPANVDNWDF